MATSSTISLLHADSTVKSFVRNRILDRETVYTDLSILDSPTIRLNELKFRASSKGSILDPSKMKNTHNSNRTMVVQGADGKLYTASVNLTVTFPGGNVIAGNALASMVEDLVILALDFDGANSVSSGTISESFDIGDYIQTVRILEV